jgi:hypothetical protein
MAQENCGPAVFDIDSSTSPHIAIACHAKLPGISTVTFRRLLSRFGLAGLIFFTAKGLIWLALAVGLWGLSGC